MSVGGYVARVKTLPGGTRAIQVVEPPPTETWSCIHVAETEANILPGDAIWWHGRMAFWTPQGTTLTDTPIRRHGWSHSDEACWGAEAEK